MNILKADIPTLIFDASILVSGKVSGGLHKTGLYRVSYEVLKQLSQCEKFSVFLFDNFHRERELKKYLQKEFSSCGRIKEFSFITRFVFFPFGDIADKFRSSESRSKQNFLRIFFKVLKNIFLTLEKTGKKVDKALFTEKNLRREFSKAKLYYSTYFPAYKFEKYKFDIKKIYTIHDLIPIIHPEYFSSPFNEKLLREVVEEITEQDTVFTVSEWTKLDLLKLRPDLHSDRIFVTPNAASETFYPVKKLETIQNIKNKYGIPTDQNYLLSLCTLEPRKNLKLLIAAFKIILPKKNISDLCLVLTGSVGWESDELLDEIKSINNEFPFKIILTGFIPDEDLAPLYSGAFAFIYPSLYEGFGLPVLEAMKCGTAVISSNTSSLPEVVGEAGILINPQKIEELIVGINTLVKNPKLYRELKEKSIVRANNFSWEESGRIIETEIHKLLS